MWRAGRLCGVPSQGPGTVFFVNAFSLALPAFAALCRFMGSALCGFPGRLRQLWQ